MTTPQVSVVISVNDLERTLDRAIKSVVAQTDGDWEIVATDDCSSDRSPEILRRWEATDPRVRVVRLNEYCGPGAARNAALQVAQGRFITYLDDGDEYFPEYFAQLRHLTEHADVLLFGYEVAYDGGQPEGAIGSWDPALRRAFLFADRIVGPLGVAHRRELWEQAGGFQEGWCDEVSDFCRRLARAGRSFAFLPQKSGRQHVLAGSLRGIPLPTSRQRMLADANWKSGSPLCGSRPLGPKARGVRRIVFASPHCLVDFGSGAAIATLDGMKLLAREGFSCEAFCGSKTDAHEEILLEESLSRQGMPYEARRATIGDMEARMIFTRQESVPVTLFQGVSTRAMGLERAESETFLKAFQAFLDRQRPDVLVTYGSDPLTMEIIYRAKLRDISVVFWLHNFSYHDTWPFRHVDYVLVPSETARRHYWEYLGLACRQLPNVADLRRVLAAKREPQYLTFVNPDPAKGVRVFARIAEEPRRRRPDIPILVVEGRSTLRQICADDLKVRELPNVRTMENTPDPRQFYSLSKLVLMPSLWRESSPLVAIEAMANGIPVLASDRGGLPETVGEGGFLFSIPARYTPETRDVAA